jgi:acetolactate synthase I/II/III large subunit
MNGAEAAVHALIAGGIKVCFANPGTSEIHLVAALDRLPEVRCICCLFEGVATGAADGYARMAGHPASTLLHLGPGLANSLANLHNASRAGIGLVNIIGDHAPYHRRHDPPLASDIEALARPYSKWLRTSNTAADVARDVGEAIVAARTAPGQIATLILPADSAWNDGAMSIAAPGVRTPPKAPKERVEGVAAMLRAGKRCGILLSGNALYGRGLTAAGRIAAATGAQLLAPFSFTRIERGAGRPAVERIPYPVEQAVELLSRFRCLILVGASPPVSFFAHPCRKSTLIPEDCEIADLARPGEDYAGTLDDLITALSLRQTPPLANDPKRPSLPTGEISPQGLATAVAALLPENTIVVDESITSGRSMMALTKNAPSHDWMVNTGGSIGIGMPLAVGAAVACPDRPVLCLSADGSGMYTLQALWTMARESLRITTVIFANRAYAILKQEYASVGVGPPGRRALDMLEIGRPDLDWVSLARGMGVPAARVTTLEGFAIQLRAGLESQGPNLVEVVL